MSSTVEFSGLVPKQEKLPVIVMWGKNMIYILEILQDMLRCDFLSFEKILTLVSWKKEPKRCNIQENGELFLILFLFYFTLLFYFILFLFVNVSFSRELCFRSWFVANSPPVSTSQQWYTTKRACILLSDNLSTYLVIQIIIKINCIGFMWQGFSSRKGCMGGFCEKTPGAAPLLDRASSIRLWNRPTVGQS